MPLGLLSDEEFDLEVNSNSKSGKIESLKIGRGNKAERDNAVRALIAETALESDESIKEIAAAFEVSKSSVSAYKNGATSTATYDLADDNLKPIVARKRREILEQSHDKLVDAIRAITPRKLEDTSVKVAASVARDLSAVIKNIAPEAQEKNDVKFVVFAPVIKAEKDYAQAIRVEE